MQKFIIYISERSRRDIDYITNLIRFSLSRSHKESFL